jgi:hypothetical protein
MWAAETFKAPQCYRSDWFGIDSPCYQKLKFAAHSCRQPDFSILRPLIFNADLNKKNQAVESTAWLNAWLEF